MELYNRIMKLRPEVDPNDFRLRDNSDGNGPFIEEWLSSETQPDDNEIASVDDSLPTAVLWTNLRTKRNRLLVETDWWASSDLSITEEQTTYRQALRDLPANTANPANPTWPVKPV